MKLHQLVLSIFIGIIIVDLVFDHRFILNTFQQSDIVSTASYYTTQRTSYMPIFLPILSVILSVLLIVEYLKNKSFVTIFQIIVLLVAGGAFELIVATTEDRVAATKVDQESSKKLAELFKIIGYGHVILISVFGFIIFIEPKTKKEKKE
jgi:membrane protein required for beta-lactamase induction